MAETNTDSGGEIKFSEADFLKVAGWLETLRNEFTAEPNLGKLETAGDQQLLPGSSPESAKLKEKATTFAKSIVAAREGMTSTTLPKMQHGIEEAIRQFKNNEDDNTYTVQQFMADMGFGTKA